MMSLDPRYRKLAALLILALVLALPAIAVWWAIDLHRSGIAAIAERKRAISRFEAIARYGPRLDEDHARSAEVTHAAWFLPAGDPAIAAAGLQARLKELAQAHGIDVAQARDLKQRVAGGTTYVGVGLEMSGRAEGIEALLRAIEASLPLIIIEGIEMRAEVGGIDPRHEPIMLYLDLSVWGALAAPPPPAKEAGRDS
jgi:hypothetical protein